MNFKWSKGNEKLLKTQKAYEKRFHQEAFFVGFSLPQLRSESGKVTCPFAGYCADLCYAGQGRFKMPSVQQSHEHNLSILETHAYDEIVELILKDLRRMMNTTHIRLHNSGDFYARWYYKVWREVARLRQDLIFYTYTKSLPFIEWDTHTKNFRIVQSIGGKKDRFIDPNKPHSRIFESHQDRKQLGYVDGNESDLPAVIGQIKIGLVYHGNRKLSEDSKKHLKVL